MARAPPAVPPPTMTCLPIRLSSVQRNVLKGLRTCAGGEKTYVVIGLGRSGRCTGHQACYDQGVELHNVGAQEFDSRMYLKMDVEVDIRPGSLL